MKEGVLESRRSPVVAPPSSPSRSPGAIKGGDARSGGAHAAGFTGTVYPPVQRSLFLSPLFLIPPRRVEGFPSAWLASI